MQNLDKSFTLLGKVFFCNQKDPSSICVHTKIYTPQIQIKRFDVAIYGYMIRKGYKDGILLVLRSYKGVSDVDVKVHTYSELEEKEVISGLSFNDFRNVSPIILS